MVPGLYLDVLLDQRDYDFAKKYKLEIIQVISANKNSTSLKEAYTGEGKMMNSEFLNNLNKLMLKNYYRSNRKEKFGKKK